MEASRKSHLLADYATFVCRDNTLEIAHAARALFVLDDDAELARIKRETERARVLFGLSAKCGWD